MGWITNKQHAFECWILRSFAWFILGKILTCRLLFVRLKLEHVVYFTGIFLNKIIHIRYMLYGQVYNQNK